MSLCDYEHEDKKKLLENLFAFMDSHPIDLNEEEKKEETEFFDKSRTIKSVVIENEPATVEGEAAGGCYIF